MAQINRLLLSCLLFWNSIGFADNQDLVREGTQAADKALFDQSSSEKWNPDHAPQFVDASVNRYVKEVLLRISKTAKFRRIYRLTISDEARVNGRAEIPMNILVTKGMLFACMNEAELAAYLGHEIGHIDLRHLGLKGDQRGWGAKLFDRTVREVTKRSSRHAHDAIDQAHDQVRDVRETGYGRKAEQEADEFGAQLAAQAGYNPYALADLFDRLAGMVSKSPTYRIAKVKGSHKALDARADHLREFLKEKGFKPEGETAEKRYRTSLASLVTLAAQNSAQQDVLRELDSFEAEIKRYQSAGERIPLDRFMIMMERLSQIQRQHAHLQAFNASPHAQAAFMEEAIQLSQALWADFSDLVGAKMTDLIQLISEVGVSMLPGIGEAMDLYELFSASDFFTGEPLGFSAQLLTAIGLLSGVGSGKAVREVVGALGNGLGSLARTGRITETVADQGRAAVRGAGELMNGLKPDAVVLGEGMTRRVNPVAESINGSTFSPPRNLTKSELMAQNKRWLQEQINQNKTFYDIGINPDRVDSVKRSPFYQMERQLLTDSGYQRQYVKDVSFPDAGGRSYHVELFEWVRR